MRSSVRLGDRLVGPGQPTYVCAEIGINHNGDVNTALRLVDAAVLAGCDAVKFQKRTPELCVPPEQRDVVRDTPWGPMTYLEYRYQVELGVDDFELIDKHCKDRGIAWFASCWDEPSVDFIEAFDPVAAPGAKPFPITSWPERRSATAATSTRSASTQTICSTLTQYRRSAKTVRAAS